MVTLDTDDTIAAIASPPGASHRGILRVSGPAMIECLSRSFTPDDGRSLTKQNSVDAIPGSLSIATESEGVTLPGDLLIWPTNRSYTRQPSAEFHTLGSPPLLQLALAKLIDAGARLAQPGEFTLRAFLSGRLDLTQAEAVLAVIDAKQHSDLRLSLQQLAGGLADPLTKIRNDLISILAELEAGLDFAEEDIEFISSEVLLSRLTSASQRLEEISNQIQQRHVEDQSITAVLTGLPNAGKSSLFNQLLNDPRAIVSDVAGTTTDYVTGKLAQDNLTIELIDTAGVEETAPTEIDAVAQKLRGERTDRAQIRIHCIATHQQTASDMGTQTCHSNLDQKIESLSPTSPDQDDLLVLTQTDRVSQDELARAIAAAEKADLAVIMTSSETGAGVDSLRQTLFERAARRQSANSPGVTSTVLRTSKSLAAASQSVELARQAAAQNVGEELIAAEIRQSLDHLGRVVGTIYTDDILDIVFGQFCIGK